jgi:integrase
MTTRTTTTTANADADQNVETCGNVRVKIYERTRKAGIGKTRRVFEVSDYSTGVRRLLGFSDLKSAKKKAKRIAELLSAGDVTAAGMRNADAASFGRASELLRELATSLGLEVPLELAVSHYVQSVKIIGADKVVQAATDFARRNQQVQQQRTVAEAATELVELKKSRGASGRYAEDLKNRLDKFAKSFAVGVDTVSTGDVQGWLDELKAAPRTVKNFRGSLCTLFKFCEARGYIAKGENPATGTEQVSTRNGDAISIFTPLELSRLLAAAPDTFKPVIALQAFAGLRSAEVMRLDYEDISGGFVRLDAGKTKTATRRLVAVLPALRDWLDEYGKKSGPVFPHTRAYFHELQRDTAERTAVKADKEKRIAAIKPVKWKANALRHSFISYRVAITKDVAATALEAGNSATMIHQHYRELVKPNEAKQWFAVKPEAPANVIRMSAAIRKAS